MSQPQHIQLFINIWTGEVGELFDYNTSPSDNSKYFKAIKFILPIPNNQSQCYYFLHQPIYKENKHQITLERRKTNLSTFQKKYQSINRYKLIGGFVVKRILDTNNKNKLKVQVTMLTSKAIQFASGQQQQKVQKLTPFLVTRSFGCGLKLRTNQIIKLGKSQFKIEELNNGGGFCQEYQENQIKNLDNQTEQESSISVCQQVTCRVCHIAQVPEDNDPLISPCSCKGSAKYIHLSCLKNWIKYKITKANNHQHQQQNPGNVFHIDKLFCQICMHPFPKKIIYCGKEHLMLNFMETEVAFMSLRNLQENPPMTEYQFQQYQNQGGYDPQIYITIPKGKTISIGRQQSNNVQLPQNSVSRKHAYFQVIQGDFYIKDIQSKFGTLVSAQNYPFRLNTKNARVAQIGNVILAFKIVKE